MSMGADGMAQSAGSTGASTASSIGSGIGGIVGAIGQKGAADDAARAVGQAGADTYAQAQKTQQQAQQQAAPTALELASMNQQLSAAGTSLQRQKQMYDSIDPALMQAGQDALKLLQGQNAGTIAPMLAQRQVQRTQLMQQLQQQLGPGGASSSAGQQALQNFDMQTNTFQAQLQQGALSTLQGFTSQGLQSGAGSGQQALGLFGQVGQQAGAIQQRQVGATFAGSLAPFAADPYAGQVAASNASGQMWGQLGKSFGQLAGSGISSGGGSTPAPAPTAPAPGYGVPATSGAPSTGGYGISGMNKAPMAAAS